MFIAGVALAIPSDATVQNVLSATGGMGVSGTISPNENNGANAISGRVFCTLYDGGRCVPINRASCNGDLRNIHFTLTAANGSNNLPQNSRMYAFATTGDCEFVQGQAPELGFSTSDLISSSGLVNGQAFDFPEDFSNNADFINVESLAAYIGACTEEGIENTRYNLCIGVSLAEGGTTPVGLASGSPILRATVLVDTVIPPAPSTFSVSGADGTFRVNVGMPSNNNQVNIYVVRYREAGDETDDVPEGTDCNTWEPGTFSTSEYFRRGDANDASSFDIGSVENGVNYEVCAGAIDVAGNQGTFSVVQRARPSNECDFIECYPGEPPTGYCGNVPAGMLAAWVGLAGLVRVVRRSRRVLPRGALTALAFAAVFVPAIAHAQFDPRDFYKGDATTYKRERPRFGFEIRGGPFAPAIGNAAEKRAYDIIYGGDTGLFDRRPLLLQIEFDWYAFNRFGLLGVYGRVGRWRIAGHTRDCVGADGTTQSCTSETLEGSSEGSSRTSLTAWPLSAGIVYKFDQLKENWSIPLVPYAKGGVDYFLWTNTVDGETSTASDGSSGSGGQFGVTGSLGIALNIDFIEPSAATNARNGPGVADFYLFFEYRWTYAGFRSSGLDWSDNHGLVGLGIDLL